MNIIRKLTRNQFMEFVDNYYAGRYTVPLPVAFVQFYTQVDDPLLFELAEEEKVLDHIETNYVESL